MSAQLKFSGKIFHSANQQNVALVLAFLMSVNKFYDLIFIMVETALYIYKGVLLPYEASDIGLEAALLALLFILEILRFSFGVKGNLMQRTSSLSLALLLTPAVILIGVHIMIWQTYVTQIDFIMGAILISFYAAEFVFIFLAIMIRTSQETSGSTRK